MNEIRKCPNSGEDCIAPKICKKTKPCWYETVQKPTHDIIAKLAKEAGQERKQ